MADTLPAWLAQMDAQEAAPPAAAPAQPQQQQSFPVPPPQQVQVPGWLSQMDNAAPESVTVTGERPPSSVGSDLGDFVANTATGVGRIPGAVIGTPHVLAHTLDWLLAKGLNGVDNLMGSDGGRTGASVDQYNPLARFTPAPETIDKHVFDTLGVKPYEPTSVIGKLWQAGITGAGAGLLDPAAFLGAVKAATPIASALEGAIPRMAKTAFAASAANGTQQLFPDNPGLAAAMAMLAHTGAGAGASTAAKGYRNFAEPIWDPEKAGKTFAGAKLAGVDNTQPGMASPTGSDISGATDATRGAVDDIGTGLSDYDAGGNIRTDLQARHDALSQTRSEAAGKAYDVFRSQPPMPGSELADFMKSPDFRNAIKAASRGSLARGQSPLTDLFHFEPEDAAHGGGEPTIIPGAAVPPDVLQRIKGALDDAVNGAPGNVQRGDLSNLRARYVAALDNRYPQTYPPTRAEFAANSRPLDPLETGKVGQAINSEVQFGNRTYTQPQERIAQSFLGSKALKSDYDNLISAYGGNRNAALGNLEQNLANKVQGAVAGDGTLSLDAFNRSVRPYTKALNMFFPELSQKFSTAEAAQKTLETLKTQKGLADDITQGGLRDEGLVTKSSATRWLDRNADALEKTQSKAAVMRLRSIVAALPENPGGGAEAAVEAAPMAIGGALGGLEGGVLGGITHNIPGYLAGPRMKAFRNIYSQGIEKAFADPAYAQSLATRAVKRGGTQSLRQVLMEEAKRGALATPGALNAGTPGAQQ